jgi:endonuclease/exonuclease/phosphatase (EEP) superfamily protein YafD
MSTKVKMDGLLLVLGVQVCLFTVNGYLGKYWWVFDLNSHFPVQYGICTFLLAIVFLAIRRYKIAIVFFAFAVINLIHVSSYFWFGKHSVDQSKSVLRVVQMNVYTQNLNYDLVKKFVQESNPDVIVMEEVNRKWMKNLADLKMKYSYIVKQPSEDNFGIALFSKLPLDNSEIIYLGDSDVPSITAEIKVGKKQIKILGTHPLPPINADYTALRNQQLDAIAEYLGGWRGSVILLGDLNTTPWSHNFQKLLRDTTLIDSGHGEGFQTTWPAKLFLFRIAIDHCLISRDLAVVSRTVGPNVGSDHLPLVVDIAVE